MPEPEDWGQDGMIEAPEASEGRLMSGQAPAAARAPRSSAAWALGAAGTLVLAAAVLLRLLWPAAPRRLFPRQPSEFPAPAQVDRMLEASAARLKAGPDDVKALVDSGLARFMKGRAQYPEAINDLEEALKLGALDSRIFYYLGVMYQEEGLPAYAMGEFERFLRNEPGDADARLLLARLLYQAGRPEEALAHYEAVAGRFPKDPLPLEHIGLCRLALKQDASAAEAFRAMIPLGPVEARRAGFHLGRLADAAGDHAGAKALFAAALPATPDLGLPPELVHAAVAANLESLKELAPARDHWAKVLLYSPHDARARAAVKSLDARLKRGEREAQRRAASSRKRPRK